VTPPGGEDEVLIGLDLGTSTLKAVALDRAGRHLAEVKQETPWHRTASGAEMSPGVLMAAATTLLGRVAAASGDVRVTGIGISAIGQTGLLLGADGEPLTPLVAWFDDRARPQAERLRADFGEPEYAALTGMPLSHQSSVTMIRWHVEHDERARHAARWLGIAEWVASQLGSGHVAERSLASQSGLMSVFEDAWSADLAGWAHPQSGLLPEIVDAGAAIGMVDRGLSALHGAVLTIGGHDHACAAIGAGASRSGDVFDSCGTAETIVAASAGLPAVETVAPLILEGRLQVGWHALAGQVMLAGSLKGGRFLGAVLDRLGVPADETEDLDATALALPEPGLFPRVDLHYDSPLDLRELDGMPAAEAWRRALATSVHASTQLIRGIERISGTEAHLVVGGGWSRNAALMRLKRAAFPDLRTAPLDEPGARGAALLAGVAAGRYPDAAGLPTPGVGVA
jgi:sugar (pentulose or hexulose) kinase